jgi:hypothetical protein
MESNFSLILAVLQFNQHDSVLSKIELGWVGHGPVSRLTTNCTALVNICCEDTEDFLNQLVKVENKLNNRQLTYVSSDPNENESITPNHLLFGQRGHVSSPEVFSSKDEISRKQWSIAQYYIDAFWNRWLQEYIPTLQTRSKWTKQSTNFKIDDIVKITGENLKRGEWPLSPTIAFHPGEDELVRVVTVRTQNKDFKRLVTKIAAVSLSN